RPGALRPHEDEPTVHRREARYPAAGPGHLDATDLGRRQAVDGAELGRWAGITVAMDGPVRLPDAHGIRPQGTDAVMRLVLQRPGGTDGERDGLDARALVRQAEPERPEALGRLAADHALRNEAGRYGSRRGARVLSAVPSRVSGLRVMEGPEVRQATERSPRRDHDRHETSQDRKSV